MQFRPRKPIFYIVKLGVSAVYIFFFIICIFVKFQWSFVLDIICLSLLITKHVFKWQYKPDFYDFYCFSGVEMLRYRNPYFVWAY